MESAIQSIHPAPIAGPRILLVDDEPAVLSTLSRMVTRWGYTPVLASSADQALQQAARHPVAAVVTDLEMPDKDGLSLIRELGALQPDLAFVILSGKIDIDVPLDETRDNVTAVLHKPWEPRELFHALQRALRLADRRSPHAATTEPTLQLLLVEGDDHDAALLVDQLRRCAPEYAITRRRRIADAQHALADGHYDVILTEAMLPDARGVDAVLRLQHIAPDTPLLVASRSDEPTLALECVHAGAQDYITKGSVRAERVAESLRYALERKRSQLQLTRLAHYDPLTHLPNRMRFVEHLRKVLSRARRHGRPFALLFIDLDGFKPVNDTHGHAAGDALLRHVAARLEATARESDFVARLGGDEFAAVVEDIDGPEGAAAAAHRITASLGEPCTVYDDDDHPTEVAVTASIGIALHPHAGTTRETLLRAADRAMYEVKARGRNGWGCAEESTPERIHAPRFGDNRIDGALGRDELRLHLQPVVPTEDAPPGGAEALLRFHDGQRFALPAAFLPRLQTPRGDAASDRLVPAAGPADPT